MTQTESREKYFGSRLKGDILLYLHICSMVLAIPCICRPVQFGFEVFSHIIHRVHPSKIVTVHVSGYNRHNVENIQLDVKRLFHKILEF